MKKLLAILLMLILPCCPMLFLSACGEEKDAPASTRENPQPLDDIPEDDGIDAPEDVKIDSWQALYQAYNDTLAEQYKPFSKAAARSGSNIDSLAMINYISGEMDLALLNGFFPESNPSVNETVFNVMGYIGSKYAEEGDTATLSTTTKAGKEKIFQLKYDGNTAEMTVSVDGMIESVLSLCVTEEYSAKTYMTSGSPKIVHILCYPNGNIYMGIQENIENHVSLYQNAEIAKDPAFVTELENGFQLVDNIFTVF